MLVPPLSFAAVTALIFRHSTATGPANPEGIRVLFLVALIGGTVSISFVHLVRWFVMRRLSRGGSVPTRLAGYSITTGMVWASCEGVAFFGLVVCLIAQSFWPAGLVSAAAWIVLAANMPLTLPGTGTEVVRM
jgi:hypothetical protein